MVKVISLDMDGTLIDAEFTDWVWKHGVPSLYAAKEGVSFEAARLRVEGEYDKVGDGAVEWYDIKYWLDLFQLPEDWKNLLDRYVDKIRVYPDAHLLLKRLGGEFPLVLTSNAGREFIEVELRATGLRDCFEHIFSVTSDFAGVKKTAGIYRDICRILGVHPREVVHVGDHYEYDYLVPQSLGIQAFYLDRSGRREGDSVLRDLGDLEGRLRNRQQGEARIL